MVFGDTARISFALFNCKSSRALYFFVHWSRDSYHVSRIIVSCRRSHFKVRKRLTIWYQLVLFPIAVWQM